MLLLLQTYVNLSASAFAFDVGRRNSGGAFEVDPCNGVSAFAFDVGRRNTGAFAFAFAVDPSSGVSGACAFAFDVGRRNVGWIGTIEEDDDEDAPDCGLVYWMSMSESATAGLNNGELMGYGN